jgi:hypothetical protein
MGQCGIQKSNNQEEQALINLIHVQYGLED